MKGLRRRPEEGVEEGGQEAGGEAPSFEKPSRSDYQLL
jgi:hypothetical protein